MIRNGQGFLDTLIYSIAIIGGMLREKLDEVVNKKDRKLTGLGVSLVEEKTGMVIY
jgi:hypothetical protein